VLSLRRSGRSALAGLTVLSFSACVGPKSPGVGITNLKSDIVFGVKDLTESAAPAALSPDLPSAQQAASDLDLPASAFDADAAPAFVPTVETAPPKPRPALQAAPKRECPDAALNAFPDRPALENLPENVLPAMGEYRFKKRGQITRADLPFPITVDGFERRLFRNLQVAAKTTGGAKSNTNPDGYGAKFTYEVVQPRVDGNGTVITTYQVFTNGRGGELSVTNPTGNNIAYREPEAGVTIKRIERRDKDNVVDGVFAPPQGLLIMPLGVRPGERFQSAAVDPTTGQSYQLSGQIIETARVDACGVITEGWRVESQLGSSGPESGTATYNYIVSTNLGGIVIAEETKSTTSEGTFDLAYSIGQLVPDEPRA
jgi:hypothetical protein